MQEKTKEVSRSLTTAASLISYCCKVQQNEFEKTASTLQESNPKTADWKKIGNSQATQETLQS